MNKPQMRAISNLWKWWLSCWLYHGIHASVPDQNGDEDEINDPGEWSFWGQVCHKSVSSSHRTGDRRTTRHKPCEGSRPEWCISSMIHSRDTPFWSGTFAWFVSRRTPVSCAVCCRIDIRPSLSTWVRSVTFRLWVDQNVFFWSPLRWFWWIWWWRYLRWWRWLWRWRWW